MDLINIRINGVFYNKKTLSDKFNPNIHIIVNCCPEHNAYQVSIECALSVIISFEKEYIKLLVGSVKLHITNGCIYIC